MKWIAQCHLCPYKVDVPSQYDTLQAAKAWASLWEDNHIKEDHSDDQPAD